MIDNSDLGDKFLHTAILEGPGPTLQVLQKHFDEVINAAVSHAIRGHPSVRRRPSAWRTEMQHEWVQELYRRMTGQQFHLLEKAASEERYTLRSRVSTLCYFGTREQISTMIAHELLHLRIVAPGASTGPGEIEEQKLEAQIEEDGDSKTADESSTGLKEHIATAYLRANPDARWYVTQRYILKRSRADLVEELSSDPFNRSIERFDVMVGYVGRRPRKDKKETPTLRAYLADLGRRECFFHFYVYHPSPVLQDLARKTQLERLLAELRSTFAVELLESKGWASKAIDEIRTCMQDWVNAELQRRLGEGDGEIDHAK